MSSTTRCYARAILRHLQLLLLLLRGDAGSPARHAYTGFLGYMSIVDAHLCAGCGICVDYCQFGAISVDNGHALVEAPTYMGCGVCVSKCPQDAFVLQRDPARGEPLVLSELMAQAEHAASGP